MHSCRVCNNTLSNTQYNVPELQLGFGNEFNYLLCNSCGSLQLEAIPADLARYYPNEDYYSFNLELKRQLKVDLLRKLKASYLLFGKGGVLGKLLSLGYKLPDYYQWVKQAGVQYDDAILDVGTGNGSLLTKLFQIGFTNLTGIDPFINETQHYGAVKVLKQDIFATTGPYKLIMMHHALEHMHNPREVMYQAIQLLQPGGILLIRIPIMGNYGWQTYGIYWCGVDAPRHMFIPSENGMLLMGQEAGLSLLHKEYDSSDYVIWSSEQYQKQIPLHAANSYMMNRDASIFTKEQIVHFKTTIAEQNLKNNGDTAAFYFQKPF
jgi:SAM-dependent methyltransferase